MGALAVKGSTLTMGTQALTFEILDISGFGEESGNIDGTHIGSSNTVNESNGVNTPLEVSLTVLFDGSQNPVVGTTNETFTIDYAGGGKTRAADGYVKSFDITGSQGDKFTASMSLMLSGAVTKVTV